MKRILVPLDGSIYSDYALDVAIQLAKDTGSHLSGMAVLDTPAIESKAVGAALGASFYATELVETLRNDALARTEKILEYFDERCNAAGVTHRARRRENDPSEAILRETIYHDLVVLPQITYFKFETQDAPDQSVVEVAKHSAAPVLAVPCKPFTRPIRRALVAWDHSLQAARALRAMLASGIPIKHIVLGTVEGGNVRADTKIVQTHLERMAEYVRAHGISCEHMSTKGMPADKLLELADTHSVDTIVMGSFSKSRVVEFFFGSVTKKLLKNESFPVLVYH